MTGEKIARARWGRKVAATYTPPDSTPKHHGAAIVGAFACQQHCGEAAAKRRLERFTATLADLTAIIRAHPEYRQWFARCLMDPVAALVETDDDDLHAAALRYSAEDADTEPELLGYLQDPTPARLTVLRREMAQERAASSHLDAILARRQMAVVR